MFNDHNYPTMDPTQSRSFIQKVYAWMALALGISGGAAYAVATVPSLNHAIYGSGFAVPLILIFAQLGLVMYLSHSLHKMSVGAATLTYVAYAMLSGITLSSIFMVYQLGSILVTFAATAGMFGAMALYGQFTKSDLSSLGHYLFMGLIGLIIANLVNIFVGSASLNLLTSAAGVMIFTLYTAYDVQMIKRMGSQMFVNGDDMFKVSIIGALKLYLDFVNLFIYLLRFFGQQKRN